MNIYINAQRTKASRPKGPKPKSLGPGRPPRLLINHKVNKVNKEKVREPTTGR